MKPDPPRPGRRKGSGVASRIKPELPVWKIKQALTYGAFQGAPGERIGARWLHLLAFKDAVDSACDAYGQKKLAAVDWFLCGSKPDPYSGPDGAKSAAARRASLEEWAKREPGDFRQGQELLRRRAECDKYLTEQRAYLIADVEEAFRKLDANFYYSIGDLVEQAAKGKSLEESHRFACIVEMLEEKVCCADGLRLINPKAVKKELARQGKSTMEDVIPTELAALATTTFWNSSLGCIEPIFSARDIYQRLAKQEQNTGTFFRPAAKGKEPENNLRQIRKYCNALGVKWLKD